jgi:SAM-dependent methyltransferase
VNRRELTIVRRLLPAGARALDLGCGTGRLSAALRGDGHRTVALDASAEMLRLARQRAGVPAVQSDAFALPLADGAFDAVVALRLLFHFPDPRPLLSEMRRVVRPGGGLVFDTYRWTPRALVPLGRGSWGERVFVHRIEPLAAELGLAVAAADDRFLFSPYLYRLLPLPLVRALDRLEPRVPPRWRARTFWRLVRV